MSARMEAKEVLCLQVLLYSAKVSVEEIRDIVAALFNMDLWVRTFQDNELTHLRAFAPEVCDSYESLLRSLRRSESSSDRQHAILSSIRLGGQMTSVPLLSRMQREISLAEQLDHIDESVPMAAVKDTLKGIFQQDSN